MRKDMNKVIVERPRRGHKNKYKDFRHDKCFLVKEDNHLFRESMKIRYKTHYWDKEFNENLNPLWRWIEKQIGRNYNDVYSEVKKTFDCTKTINDHILIHLKQHITTCVVYHEDGSVHHGELKYTRWNKNSELNYGDIYVAKDGTLQKYVFSDKPKTKKQRQAERTLASMKICFIHDGKWMFKKINGIWYYAFLKKQKYIYEIRHNYDADGNIISSYKVRSSVHVNYFNDYHYINGVEYVPVNGKQCESKILHRLNISNDVVPFKENSNKKSSYNYVW